MMDVDLYTHSIKYGTYFLKYGTLNTVRRQVSGRTQKTERDPGSEGGGSEDRRKRDRGRRDNWRRAGRRTKAEQVIMNVKIGYLW